MFISTRVSHFVKEKVSVKQNKFVKVKVSVKQYKLCDHVSMLTQLRLYNLNYLLKF